MRLGIPGRRGFTLVEVLVVLAILVILFGLLFAPMMTSMDMAARGRAQVRMQDAARLSMEQIHRELAEAMYVYPTPTIYRDAGAPIAPNYSQLVFVAPDRDNNGQPYQPLRPRKTVVGGNTLILATRFVVLTARQNMGNNQGEHDADNPFVLWRQDGTYEPDANNIRRFTPISQGNALSPKDKTDIVPTVTIDCTDGTTWPGYYYPPIGDPRETDTFAYTFQGVQFVPDRIAGEFLTPNADGFLYTASHGAWLGTPNDGTVNLTLASLIEGALDPRLVVYREGQTSPVLDSYQTAPRSMNVSWDSSAGTVRVGQFETRSVTINPTAIPGPGALWSVAPSQPDVVPVNPPPPTLAGDARAPIAYRIQPPAANPVKIVPSAVRVWVTATYSNGIARTTEYTSTTDTDQAELGASQFAVVMDANNRGAEIRFSRYQPPSPDPYLAAGGSVTGFRIDFLYYSRNNFDPTTNIDDRIRADYWTRDTFNVTLMLTQYVDLEADPVVTDALVVPANAHPARITMRDTVALRNPGR